MSTVPYCNPLQGSQEIEQLVDLISTNHTKFFREPDHFSFLTRQALPALLPRLVASRSPLRVWSAAASSGEEPYTIAIVLAEHLRAYPSTRVGNHRFGYLQAHARRG